jgi:hypothetical protein
LAAALVLSGCGGSTPSSTPTPSSSPSPTESVPPPTSTSPSPSPSKQSSSPAPAGDSELELLPPSCTTKDDVHIVSSSRNGAGGTSYDYWRLKADHNCTLEGVPKVALYDSSGARVPAAVAGYSGWFGYKNVRSWPTEVGPQKTAQIQIAKYRCDTTPHPRMMTSATFTLPLGRGAVGDAGVVRAKLSFPLPYCPHDEGNQQVHVAPVGFRDGTEPEPYAVSMHSSFDPGTAPTWGRADLDGDGLADTVIVRPNPKGGHAMVDVEFGDGTGSQNELALGEPIRLQALSDLNGDGVPEILVGTTAEGVESGYAFGSSGSYVLQVTPADKGVPVSVVKRKGGRPWMPSISNYGRGDLWAALQCRDDDVTQVTALLAGAGPFDLTGTNAYDVTRTTWHVEGATAVKVSTTKSDGVRLTSTMVDGAWTPIVSDCPGMSSTGWAAND